MNTQQVFKAAYRSARLLSGGPGMESYPCEGGGRVPFERAREAMRESMLSALGCTMLTISGPDYYAVECVGRAALTALRNRRAQPVRFSRTMPEFD